MQMGDKGSVTVYRLVIEQSSMERRRKGGWEWAIASAMVEGGRQAGGEGACHCVGQRIRVVTNRASRVTQRSSTMRKVQCSPDHSPIAFLVDGGKLRE
jgi:hypothetical protein